MKDHGLAGVLLPGVAPDTPWIEPLYSPIYDPLWAVCQELEMPVTHHSGGSGIPAYGDYPFYNTLFVLETGFFCNRAFWHLVVSGVFDRFPDLKLVLTEQGTAVGAGHPGPDGSAVGADGGDRPDRRARRARGRHHQAQGQRVLRRQRVDGGQLPGPGRR